MAAFVFCLAGYLLCLIMVHIITIPCEHSNKVSIYMLQYIDILTPFIQQSVKYKKNSVSAIFPPVDRIGAGIFAVAATLQCSVAV